MITLPVTSAVALIAGAPSLEKNPGDAIRTETPSGDTSIEQATFLPTLVVAMAGLQQQPLSEVPAQGTEVAVDENSHEVPSELDLAINSLEITDEHATADHPAGALWLQSIRFDESGIGTSMPDHSLVESWTSSNAIEHLPVEAQLTRLQDGPEFAGIQFDSPVGETKAPAHSAQTLAEHVERSFHNTDQSQPDRSLVINAKPVAPGRNDVPRADLPEEKTPLSATQGVEVENTTRQQPVAGGAVVRSLQDISASSFFGIGERTFRYQIARNENNGHQESTTPSRATDQHASPGIHQVTRQIETLKKGLDVVSDTSVTRGQAERPASQETTSPMHNGNNTHVEQTVVAEASKGSAEVAVDGQRVVAQAGEPPTRVNGPRPSQANEVSNVETGEALRKDTHETPAEGTPVSTRPSQFPSNSSDTQAGLNGGHQQDGLERSTTVSSPVIAKPVLDAKSIASYVVENLQGKLSNEIVGQLREGVTEVRLMLKPESLGELSLKISLDDDVVTAQIQVAQPEVKAALEAHVAQLRDALTARGVDAHRIDIFTASDAQARESHGQQDGRQKQTSKKQAHTAPDEPYKGTRLMGYNTIEITM